MKKRSILKSSFCLFIIAFFFINCNSDDDSQEDCNCDIIIEKTYIETIDLGSNWGLRDVYRVVIQNVCDEEDTEEFMFSEIPNEPLINVGECFE